MDPQTRKGNAYGGSLPVQNVQQLASGHLKDVPDRYIRPEVELDQVSEDESVPVIDLAKLSADQLGYEHEMEKLHEACKHWGFFQLINHGATEAAIEKMKVDVQEFFKLPLEEKMVYAQLPDSIEGFGQVHVVSEDQKLDWGDMLFLYPLPVSKRNIKFWPAIPSSFRSTLDKYSAELHAMAIRLLGLMAINLGIDSEKLNSMYEDGKQGIRMNYYPPCVQANKVIGLTPHTDSGGLTLLIQVNDVPGLQIKRKDKWVPIKPIPGAIIVNIGDITEIMTNGEYSSIRHRAMVGSEKERLSIAAFHGPNLRTKIGPLPDLVKEKAAKYSTVDYEDFLRMLFTSKLGGESLPQRMRIKY